MDGGSVLRDRFDAAPVSDRHPGPAERVFHRPLEDVSKRKEGKIPIAWDALDDFGQCAGVRKDVLVSQDDSLRGRCWSRRCREWSQGRPCGSAANLREFPQLLIGRREPFRPVADVAPTDSLSCGRYPVEQEDRLDLSTSRRCLQQSIRQFPPTGDGEAG